jgi:hypothetical protein
VTWLVAAAVFGVAGVAIRVGHQPVVTFVAVCRWLCQSTRRCGSNRVFLPNYGRDARTGQVQNQARPRQRYQASLDTSLNNPDCSTPVHWMMARSSQLDNACGSRGFCVSPRNCPCYRGNLNLVLHEVTRFNPFQTAWG